MRCRCIIDWCNSIVDPWSTGYTTFDSMSRQIRLKYLPVPVRITLVSFNCVHENVLTIWKIYDWFTRPKKSSRYKCLLWLCLLRMVDKHNLFAKFCWHLICNLYHRLYITFNQKYETFFYEFYIQIMYSVNS